jgi:pyruvate oxidase
MAINKQNETIDTNLAPTTQNVAEVILSQLASWGVKNMYGVAGDATLSFMEAVGKQNSIHYYAVRHESAAAFMASAEGKCTNRLGVCVATSGPGLVNMLNGVADAAADHIPLLIITGQVKTDKVGTEAKQYVEQQQMIAPLAVYSASLLHPEATVKVFQKAILEALSKKGVSHVSVPKDIFTALCSNKIHPPVGTLWNEKRQDLHQLDQATMYLSTAQKPMLVTGEGARGASEQIIRMAEILQAGIIETLGAKGVVPFDHPLNLGGVGEGGTEESRQILVQADCVLAIGANWWPEGFVPKQTKVIHIDISSTSIESHAEVVCGLLGDAMEVLPLLHEKVRQQTQGKESRREGWHLQIQKTKDQIRFKLDQERALSTVPIAPQKLIAALDQTVSADALMVLDTGDHTIWFNRIFRAQEQQVLFSGKWRTMGFGLPAAISAKLSYPEKQVVALVGDGGFAMTMMELSTAVRYGVPIIVIVVNNQSLAMEKNKMLSNGMQPFSVELTNPNFAELAHSFGAKGIRVEQENELIPALQEAYTANQPVILDVLTSDVMPPLTAQSS